MKHKTNIDKKHDNETNSVASVSESFSHKNTMKESNKRKVRITKHIYIFFSIRMVIDSVGKPL